MRMNSDPDLNQNIELKLKKELSRICRVCLINVDKNASDLISFKCELDGLFNNMKILDLYLMISTTNYEAAEINTDYSKKICQNCLNDLVKYVKFKNKIEIAETILKYYINKGSKNGMVLEELHDEESNVKIILTADSNSNHADSNSNHQFNEHQSNDFYENDFNCEDNDSTETVNEINGDFELIHEHNDVVVNYNESNELLLSNLQQNAIELDLTLDDNLSSNESGNNIVENNETTQEKSSSLKCNNCLENFKFEEDLNLHSLIHTNDLKCSKCNKIFKENRQLRRHIKIHFKDMPFKCIHCNNKGFPEINALTRHIKNLHSNGKKIRKFVCNEMNCFKKYYDSYSLKVHQRIHRNEKPYQCNECDKPFNDIRLLNSHIKTHSGEKKYCCKYCDKKFTHRSTLNSHIRTHTNEKPYVCVICNKSFCQSSNLRAHMITHTKDKLHECKICNKKYTTSTALHFHLQIHSNAEKPQYNCNVCSKKFSRPNLTAHMRIHKNEKPFNCENCSTQFRTKSQLKVHQKTIHLKDKCNKNIVFEKANVNENQNRDVIEDDQLLNENMILVNTLLDNITDNFLSK